MDEDGFVYILGRASDYFITTNNEKIYCFDIEEIILQNENIAGCEVVGLEKDNHYEAYAYLVKRGNVTLADEQLIANIHESCKAQLSSDYIPHGYTVLDAFPVKNNGKRDMELLKNMKEGFVFPINGVLQEVKI